MTTNRPSSPASRRQAHALARRTGAAKTGHDRKPPGWAAVCVFVACAGTWCSTVLWLVDEPRHAARAAVATLLLIVAWVWVRLRVARYRGGSDGRPADEQVVPAGDSQTSQLPRIIDRPLTSPGLAVGVSPTGPVLWDLDRCPHMLVTGETGSGKSVLMRSLAEQAVDAEHRVIIVDPKRVGMLDLRGRAEQVATSERAMVDAVEDVAAEMHRRYEALEAGESVDNLPHLILVIDELRQFVRRSNALWLRPKTGDREARGVKSGTEHPAVDAFNELAGMGRECKVHLLAGLQRPDARAMGQQGGDARDNFRARVALGSLSEDGAMMMFGRADVGREVADVPGRGTCSMGGAPFEVQVYAPKKPSPTVLTQVSTSGIVET